MPIESSFASENFLRSLDRNARRVWHIDPSILYSKKLSPRNSDHARKTSRGGTGRGGDLAERGIFDAGPTSLVKLNRAPRGRTQRWFWLEDPRHKCEGDCERREGEIAASVDLTGLWSFPNAVQEFPAPRRSHPLCPADASPWGAVRSCDYIAPEWKPPPSLAAPSTFHRIASAYWQERDPQLIAHQRALFEGLLKAFPNPVPEGQNVEAYFDANYEKVGPTAAYIWFQARMCVAAFNEMPSPTFARALKETTP